MISFSNISKHFSEKTTLHNVSVDIKPGEFLCVTGPSGAGKSTLINLLIGYANPSKGSITVDGNRIDHMDFDTKQLFRRHIGIVSQDYKLLPKRTVYENVAFALQVSSSYTPETIKKKVHAILKRVGLDHVMDSFPEELSGGEQQRTAMARALVHEPKLLIADEPTGNLDTIASKNIIDLLKNINKAGTTIVLTTHNLDIIKYLDTRLLVLKEGHVVFDGKSKDALGLGEEA